MTIRCINATHKILISVIYKGTFILAQSTFSHNVRLCITANACILVQSHVSGRIRYKDCRSHKTSIKDARDCWSNSNSVRSFPRTHLKRTHTHSRVYTVRILNFPPLFCAWMNKYRQNYIKMHVLASMLVNSRLSSMCLNVKTAESRHVSVYQICAFIFKVKANQ